MIEHKFYVIQVVGDVDPKVHGPYKTQGRQSRAAKRIRAADTDEPKDGIYWADVSSHGELTMGAYSNGFFEE